MLPRCAVSLFDDRTQSITAIQEQLKCPLKEPRINLAPDFEGYSRVEQRRGRPLELADPIDELGRSEIGPVAVETQLPGEPLRTSSAVGASVARNNV